MSEIDYSDQLAELRELIQAQGEQISELGRAKTPQEKREAQTAIREGGEDLAGAARKLGLSLEEVEGLKKARTKTELRELLAEIRAEEKAEAEKAEQKDDEKNDEKDDEKDAEGKATVTSLKDAQEKARKGEKVKPPAKPKEDDPPVETPAPSLARRLFG